MGEPIGRPLFRASVLIAMVQKETDTFKKVLFPIETMTTKTKSRVLLFILSQENLPLSLLELKTTLHITHHHRNGEVVIAAVPQLMQKRIPRLACTKKAFEILFEAPVELLEESLESYSWKKIYKKNFCVRAPGSGNEAKYGGRVWRSLKREKIKPKVNLDHPDLLIEIFIKDGWAIVCRGRWENGGGFKERRSHLTPGHHPTTMNPKFARTLVNLADASTIRDPFCGSGGIITEACLIGLRARGSDIDRGMIIRAQKNLQHAKIAKSKYSVTVKDATKIKSLTNIVTDLPYGKSSKMSSDIMNLYAAFIKNITGNAVIVFPDFVDFKIVLRKHLKKSLIVKHIISHYVHKSLTRYIVVIKKK